MRADRPRPARLLAAGLVAGLLLTTAACSGSDGSDDGAASTSTRPATSTTAPKPDDGLRLNQIQVIGTHNSFHRALPADEHALLDAMNPEQAAQRTYTHPALTTQLGRERIRQIELDVFADTDGGRYRTPAFRVRTGKGPLSDPAMAEPGTKVLHEQDVDYASVCPTLVACLREVKAWSDAHREHVPIAIAIQLKDGPLIFPVPEQAKPEPWDEAHLRALDAEITSVFPAERIITPDDVRGDAASVNAAVLADGWPTLGESRGKVLFLMVNPEPYRSRYLAVHPELVGAVLFTNGEPGQADAAYVGLDDPIADGAKIRDLVDQGYLVRTRADANGTEATANDTTRLEAALASGAHMIATDYPGPDGVAAVEGSTYVAQLPGFRAARCNPVTAPDDCEDARVEP